MTQEEIIKQFDNGSSGKTCDQIVKELNGELEETCCEKIKEYMLMYIREHNLNYNVDSDGVIRFEIDDRVFSLRPYFEECPF